MAAQRRSSHRQTCLVVIAAILFALLGPVSLARAAVGSVTLVGTLQTEAGCTQDWDPN